jgi:hypothetical protein
MDVSGSAANPAPGNFHKMGRDKIRLIRDFTKSGVDVLISDIDVAWLRDPIPVGTGLVKARPRPRVGC